MNFSLQPRVTDALYVVGAYVVLLLIWLLDIYLPSGYVVSSLYAVPILIVAFRFDSKAIVLLVGISSVAADVAEALYEHTLFLNEFLSACGLAAILFLTVLFIRQKKTVERHAAEASASKAQLQSFMSMVSHELSQPLHSLKLQLQLMQMEKNFSDTEILEQIRQSQESLQSLVRDLGEAAQMGSGQFSIQPQHMNLTQLLAAVVREQQAKTTAHRILFNPGDTVEGTWDAGRLRQLFTNLLSNAIKYSPQGGEVRVAVNAQSEFVAISITDQGLGIAPEKIPKLFQPFSRQYSGTDIQGLGMGLYICKTIAEAHGGSIEIQSAVGEGTTFTVRLPL